jgi:hypothetical protein
VEELAQAQQRTEDRVEQLAQSVTELAQAQKRTEQRVEELAQAQKRTEDRVEQLAQSVTELAQAQKRTEDRVEQLAQSVTELAQAQKRTEDRVEQLAQSVTELAQAQKRTEGELDKFRHTFNMQIGGLGARWGLQTEEAFRQGIRTILAEVGFTIERFLDMDTAGEVFGAPEQIELDIVIKNGKVLVIEIKSSLDRGAVYQFVRKVGFYARKTGRQVDRKLIITPYADARAQNVSNQLGVEICTDVVELR